MPPTKSEKIDWVEELSWPEENSAPQADTSLSVEQLIEPAPKPTGENPAPKEAVARIGDDYYAKVRHSNTWVKIDEIDSLDEAYRPDAEAAREAVLELSKGTQGHSLWHSLRSYVLGLSGLFMILYTVFEASDTPALMLIGAAAMAWGFPPSFIRLDSDPQDD